jgi:hypothetical protein
MHESRDTRDLQGDSPSHPPTSIKFEKKSPQKRKKAGSKGSTCQLVELGRKGTAFKKTNGGWDTFKKLVPRKL